jgi:hypothetical protein
MTTQHRNFKNISGGSRNDAFPMYINLKIPKSCETVSLNRWFVFVESSGIVNLQYHVYWLFS